MRILPLIIGLSCVVSLNAGQQYFVQDSEQAKWGVRTSRLECRMTHVIDDYGTARFIQRSAREPYFSMTSWEGMGPGIYANISAVPPAWKPRGEKKFIKKIPLHAGSRPVRLDEKLARHLLSGLSSGEYIRFDYLSDTDNRVSVALSPVNFQAAFSQYIRCVGLLIPFAFSEVENSVIYFTENSSRLSWKDKWHLDRVVHYVKVDPQVKYVYVAGFSDNQGRQGYNNAISELRAKHVAAYLKHKGIKKDKLKITWFGEKQPYTTNTTEDGRKMNRRVIVRIEK